MDVIELWREQLKAHLPTGLGGRDRVIERLLGYLALLDKWNRSYNLTGVRDRASWVPRHVLDSLTLLPWLDDQTLLDVGSGAGLPGIPLAIAAPDVRCTLLDSNGKKTRFLDQVRRALDLDNVVVRRARVDDVDDERYAVIASRAFAPLPDMVAATRRLLAADGSWLAMKSLAVDAEIAALPDDIAVECHPLRVPLLDAPRQIVQMRPRAL